VVKLSLPEHSLVRAWFVGNTVLVLETFMNPELTDWGGHDPLAEKRNYTQRTGLGRTTYEVSVSQERQFWGCLEGPAKKCLVYVMKVRPVPKTPVRIMT
jgi:hypothetical protein